MFISIILILLTDQHMSLQILKNWDNKWGKLYASFEKKIEIFLFKYLLEIITHFLIENKLWVTG